MRSYYENNYKISHKVTRRDTKRGKLGSLEDRKIGKSMEKEG